MADPVVIDTADLRKQYGTVEALRGIFQTGHLPWTGLMVSAAGAAALLYGAAMNVARLDF